MNHLKNKDNLIVYLNTSFDILKQRTENFTNRGIVFNGLTAEELYSSRDKLYKKYADIEINCDNLSISHITAIIYNFFSS